MYFQSNLRMLLRFISSMCGHRHFMFPVFEDILFVLCVCVCSKPFLSRKTSVPSAAGSYITLLITATRITCSALADTHSFSPAFTRSVAISSSRLALVSSPLNLSYFHFCSIKRSLWHFVSFCLFSLSVATSSLCALFYRCHFGCVPKLPASLCFHFFFLSFSLSSLSVAIYLPSASTSLFLSPSLSLAPSGLQLKYYKCYCILARGQISKAINQYSGRIM